MGRVGSQAGGRAGTYWALRTTGVEEAGVYPSLHLIVHHQSVSLHPPRRLGQAGLDSADGVESLHAGVVALQGLADVLGVAVSHAVHVEVAQAGAQHHHHLRQYRSIPAQSSCGERNVVCDEILSLFLYFLLWNK